MFDSEEFTTKVVQAGYSADSAVYKAVSDALVALGQHDLSSGEQESALNLLSELGRSDILGFPNYTDGSWGEFDYGSARPGHYVRVHPEAYNSATGEAHNGLVGVLLKVSGRRCSVRYLANPDKSPMTHPIKNLQSIKTVIRLRTELNKMKEN